MNPMPHMQPLSDDAYLQSKKGEIKHQLCIEGMKIPEVHKWLCYMQQYWVGEGQLRYAIGKWKEAEPEEWNPPLHPHPRPRPVPASLPSRPAPRIVVNNPLLRHTDPKGPTHGARHHQHMWLQTSSIGVGQGAMASTYVPAQRAPEPGPLSSAFFGADVPRCEHCNESEAEGDHRGCWYG